MNMNYEYEFILNRLLNKLVGQIELLNKPDHTLKKVYAMEQIKEKCDFIVIF